MAAGLTDLQQAINIYQELDWRIFPLVERTKTPLTEHGYKDASLDGETIDAWWTKSPSANIGLACGPSGLIALDVDPHRCGNEGLRFADDLVANHPTTTQISPTDGKHLIYLLPDDVRLSNSPGRLPTGIDVRCNGYVLLSPSIVTYTGQEAIDKGVAPGFTGPYRWMDGRSPQDLEPQPLPDHVLELLKPKQRTTPTVSANGVHPPEQKRVDGYANAALQNELDKLARAVTGGRNQQLNDSAFNLAQLIAGGVLDESTVRDQLLTVALAIGLSEREARGTIESGVTAGKLYPRSVPEEPKLKFGTNGQNEGKPAGLMKFAAKPHHTDMGNAKRMASVIAGKAFHVKEFDRWYIWHDTHWQEDTTFEIMRFAKQTVMEMYNEASEIDDDDKRKELIKWAMRSESRQRLEAMISLARSEAGITISPKQLDQHSLLLACKNGTFDLATGDLLPPDPAHLLTKCLDLEYSPDAECPIWEKFLLRIMANDLDLISFIQRLLGHALTGDATGKYLVFLYGSKGNNGKSTLIETIMRLLGPYALKSPTDMIMAKSHRGSIPNDIARLRGVRFTVTNEVDEGMTLSESIVKDLTGNDTLTARFMRAEFFDFTPTHKLWIYGNHKPEIQGTDPAIWDRVKLIPFEVEIPKEERDPQLIDKLVAELPGIFAWAVRGNLLWQRKGISAPIAVEQATSSYRTEQDLVGEFLKECCEFGGNYEISAGRVFQVYETWCKQLGLKPGSGMKFGNELRRRGMDVKRTRTGKVRQGLQLNNYGQSLTPGPAPHWMDDR